jgi:hypothetical protein
MSSLGTSIHKALVVFGLLLTFAGFVYIPMASAAPATLYDNLVDGAYKSTNNVYLAQSFGTNSQGGNLSEVSFMYRGSNEANSFAGASSITVHLYSSNGSQPVQQLATLGSVSVDPWSNNTYTVPISTPINLAPSDEYFIVLNGASSGTAVWKFTNTVPTNYVGDTPTAFTSSNAASWTSLNATYFSLKVVSTPPAVLPNFGTLENLDCTYGDSSFDIDFPTSSAAGTWNFGSSDTSVFSVNGNTIDVIGAGTATLTADFTPIDSSAYLPGSVTATISVLKANVEVLNIQDIEVSSQTWPVTDELPALENLVPGTWFHSASGNVSITGNQYSVSAVGEYVITSTLTPLDTNNYNTLIIERNLVATQIPIPTPTETETADPTPTPSPSKTNEPSPTASPTPTSTASPTPEASNTPEVKPTKSPFESESDQPLFRENFFAESPAPILAEIIANTGTPIDSAIVKFFGEGLEPNSSVSVTVYSTPTIIFQGFADSTGKISAVVTLPSELENSTTHSVVIEGTELNGETVLIVGAVAVDENSDVIGVAPTGEVADFNADTQEELARAATYGLPIYDAKVNVLTTAGIAIASTSLLALGGAGGMARNFNSGSSSSNSERSNSQAKLANVVTKKLKAVNAVDSGYGDLNWTSRPFKSEGLDASIASLVMRTGKFSALLPRLLVDGSWIRVLSGSGSILIWIASASLALWDALSNPGNLAKPTDWVLFVLILFSFVDALAGVTAFLTIATVAVLQGEISIAADLRMLLGLGVLMTSLPLLVHVIRPLRRLWREDTKAKVERFFDYIMPPTFVAFAAGSMLKALNGLSGLELVNPDQITFIRWAGFFGVLIRMFGEDIAGGLFPKRSLEVHPAKLPSPGKLPSFVSVLLRTAIFLFVAEPFFGLTPLTIAAASLIAFPFILKLWEDDLPNFKSLHRWFPRGLLRFSITLVVGILLARNLLGAEPTDELIRSSFIWLLIPNFLVAVLELFGRSGGDWNNVWIKWLSGAAIWGFTILLTLGVVQI